MADSLAMLYRGPRPRLNTDIRSIDERQVRVWCQSKNKMYEEGSVMIRVLDIEMSAGDEKASNLKDHRSLVLEGIDDSAQRESA